MGVGVDSDSLIRQACPLQGGGRAGGHCGTDDASGARERRGVSNYSGRHPVHFPARTHSTSDKARSRPWGLPRSSLGVRVVLSLVLAAATLVGTQLPASAAPSNSPELVPFTGTRTITATWGAPSGGYHAASQPAIDVSMSVGQPIYAAGAGVVSYKAVDNRNCNPNTYPGGVQGCINAGYQGTRIHIKHPDGSTSLYLHLSAIVSGIERDKPVTAGQLIGASGNSGTSTAPHLHYEERNSSNVGVNPGNWTACHGSTLVNYDNLQNRKGQSVRNDGYGCSTSSSPKGNQFLADVTGDGRADSVIFFASTGDWYVAPSLGSSFGGYTRWISGHGVGSGTQLLADVTGDGRADSVIFFASTGDWYVAPSLGSSFGGYTRWISGHGVGSGTQLLADVTGDGRADSVIFIASTGDWYVAPSLGSSFGGYTRWISGHGVGSGTQLLADVTGDGRADSVIFIASTGDWYVAPSLGSSFGGYTRWISGHGVGSGKQLLGDATGDGRADSVIFIASTGDWYVAPSLGSSFGGYTRWISGHGVGSGKQLLGDATGDGRADSVIFIASTGDWYVAPSLGSSFGGYTRWISGHGAGS